MTVSHCGNADDVIAAVTALRIRSQEISRCSSSEQQGRVVRVLAALASLWERRLSGDWSPRAESSFPWAQIRLSLAALLPGLAKSEAWLSRSQDQEASVTKGGVAALVLAGNTPLLAWSPLAAALLAGYAVFIKQSRDETVWSRLFVESLAEVDSELASLVHLDLWPGADPRTAALLQSADVAIAYGSDSTLFSLRTATPWGTPFFGYGHAVSIGVAATDGLDRIGRFARDILLYDQGGCLSAQAVFVETSELEKVKDAARILARSLEQECAALGIPPVTDPAAARSVRQARDLALFRGYDVSVIGDPALRWTIILHSSAAAAEFPTGSCVVQILPLPRIEGHLNNQVGAMQGSLSSVGVAGTLSSSARDAILAQGVSRICRAGEMQMPPLDWPNGGRNLLAELLNAEKKAETISGVG